MSISAFIFQCIHLSVGVPVLTCLQDYKCVYVHLRAYNSGFICIGLLLHTMWQKPGLLSLYNSSAEGCTTGIYLLGLNECGCDSEYPYGRIAQGECSLYFDAEMFLWASVNMCIWMNEKGRPVRMFRRESYGAREQGRVMNRWGCLSPHPPTPTVSFQNWDPCFPLPLSAAYTL